MATATGVGRTIDDWIGAKIPPNITSYNVLTLIMAFRTDQQSVVPALCSTSQFSDI